MVFILRKSWEFQADTLEEAKRLVSGMQCVIPEECVQTSEDLSIAEESLENHWAKYGE